MYEELAQYWEIKHERLLPRRKYQEMLHPFSSKFEETRRIFETCKGV